MSIKKILIVLLILIVIFTILFLMISLITPQKRLTINCQQILSEKEIIFIQNGWRWTQVEEDIVFEVIKISDLIGFDWKLVAAIAQLETQMGTKTVGKNNLFNITCGEGCFRVYSSTEESILDFINLLMTSDYYKEFQVSKKLEDLHRYAEDPLWETKVQQIMNKL